MPLRFSGKAASGASLQPMRAPIWSCSMQTRTDDLSTLRRPLGVMVNGHWRDAKAIASELGRHAQRHHRRSGRQRLGTSRDVEFGIVTIVHTCPVFPPGVPHYTQL